MSGEKRLIVLISGRGSNLRAILDSPIGDAVIAVISDRKDAGGLAIARQYGKEAIDCCREDYPSSAAFEKALAEKIVEYQAGDSPAIIIALAGFMRILSAAFVAAHAGRLVNIHPSLLPKFPGLHTHRQALAANAAVHGCTVHWVSEKVDGGEIIAQRQVPVLPDDNEVTLEKRVLAAEHSLYPQVLAQLLNGGE